MFSLDDLDRASRLVHAVMPPTPQYAWPLLQRRFGVEVIVKHENHTPIGAFKLRGGLVYLDRLKRERPQVRGIVSATRGNHGQSLAPAGRHLRLPVSTPDAVWFFRDLCGAGGLSETRCAHAGIHHGPGPLRCLDAFSRSCLIASASFGFALDPTGL
jgi:hypothetical protein